MTSPPDDAGSDRVDASWPADTFDRWLAALDITDADLSMSDASAHDDEPTRTVASGAADPWIDVDLESVDLTTDQRAYLLWHEDQPPVARLWGVEPDPPDH